MVFSNYSFICLTSFLLFAFMVGCKSKNHQSVKRVKPVALSYHVVATYQHNSDFYTQGFCYQDSLVIEGTGQKGKSAVYQYPLMDINSEYQPTAFQKRVSLDKQFFGEGITIMNNQLYQLTWKSGSVFVYSYPEMKRLHTLHINHEGWGLTHDNQFLIMSDGTSTVRWLNPTDLSEVKKVYVTDKYGRVDRINELELIQGKLYANRWQTNHILQIDTASGQVTGKIKLSSLQVDAKSKTSSSEVLNGIAYREDTKTMLITGKNWPLIYEISFAAIL